MALRRRGSNVRGRRRRDGRPGGRRGGGTVSRNESDSYIYPPTGEELTRVTTVLDGTEGKRYLVPWSAKLASERAVDDIETVLKLLQVEGREAAVDYLK